ncbi:transketolase [Vaginisenegalia massiliensis]|uniref:transketolase n=1 Tax=Vaginisenegalia massiliensis TaxID=2058294 RepID=UPI000F542D8C|nr:transketolase [Vaginisenegalia massiliensis]
MFNEKDLIAVNSLRSLSVTQIEAANSGHPGLPLGAAPMAYALWAGHLNITAQAEDWLNRDRFVLSAGHGSALLYSLLHAAGFKVSIDDLKQFRQLGSLTPGHPEFGHTPGVEATTGPLGQGIAQAVGMALAEAHLAAQYNTADHSIIDHYTYALCGDGDLMEGISYEACSFAGKQELGKLVVLYDSNDISLDGELKQAFVEDIKGRFEAQNWHYQKVTDGNDLNAISQAIEAAKAVTNQPSIIEIKTVIGFGAPNAGTSKVHGAPLGADAWAATKATYQWVEEDFTVPQVARELFQSKMQERGFAAYQAWQEGFKAYQEAYPEKAQDLLAAFAGQLPANYDQGLTYVGAETKADASRNSSGKAIQVLGQNLPFFWGGSADLSGSNKTMNNADNDFMPDNRQGRNIWFGVREFAMGAMMNGVALHGGSKIYGGTFFVFADYLKPAVRLSALAKLPVTYVMTHDSIAVGEDGPTHEPIEQLAAFRATPNLNVIRPADVNETFAAWKVAVESQDRPTMLVLSRQNLPVLATSQSLAEEGVRKGAYVVSPSQSQPAQGILIATGSEVALAIQAQAALAKQGHDVAVVSMPSQNLFDEQDAAYRESVLPQAVSKRVSIEMASTFGWAKYLGHKGASVGIDGFGASGPGEKVMEHFGFTVDNVVNTYLNLD